MASLRANVPQARAKQEAKLNNTYVIPRNRGLKSVNFGFVLHKVLSTLKPGWLRSADHCGLDGEGVKFSGIAWEEL
ncbi:hypothetical protein [Nocardiopsis flavescens]